MIRTMTETELFRLKSLWPDLFPGRHSPAEISRLTEHLCARHNLARVAIHRVKAGGVDRHPMIAFNAVELGAQAMGRIERAIELTGQQSGSEGGSSWMVRCGEQGELRTSSLLVGHQGSDGAAFLFVFTAIGEIARQTAAELAVISQNIAVNSLETFNRDAQMPAKEAVSKLSQRELECLLWTAEGKTSEDIAIILQLSVHTINHYLTAATRKLNAVNRLHAVARAMRLGLLSASFGENRDMGNKHLPAAAM